MGGAPMAVGAWGNIENLSNILSAGQRFREIGAAWESFEQIGIQGLRQVYYGAIHEIYR